MPTKWDLDEVAPDRYVYLMRTCGHMAVVNSKLLESEGIDYKTKNPKGGIIFRDGNGEANGLLLGQAHMGLKKRTAPSRELIEKGMLVINREFMENGITSAGDMSGRNTDEIKLFQEKVKKGEIHYRIYLAVRATDSILLGIDCLKTGLFTGFGNKMLKLGCFKTQLDGSDTVPSAAMWSPYPNKMDFSGTIYMTQEQLDEIVLKGHMADYQISVHAMGTKAIEMTLNSYERALEKYPKIDHRFRIEHCHFCDDKLAKRISELKVIPVLAPGWIYWNGDSYLKNYHKEWLDWIIACRRLIDRGVKVAFHSDLPVIPSNPIFGLYSAVSRKTESGNFVGESQKISLKEAIKAYTYNGAFATFEEYNKGSIAVGKLADLCVLSKNIQNIDAETILSCKIDLTMVDGKIQYQREKTI
jgi:predicted amidohydrolase YtcJ